MLLLSVSDFDVILCSWAVVQTLKFGSSFCKLVREQFDLSTKPMETLTPQINKLGYDTCKTLEPDLYEHQMCSTGMSRAGRMIDKVTCFIHRNTKP